VLDAREADNKFDRAINVTLDLQLPTNARADVYVSSFTENADQLSQWRAYCPASGGYAIGFKAKDLVPGTKALVDRFMAHCVYETDAQRRLAQEIVEVVAQTAYEHRHEGMEQDRILRESYKLFGRFLLTLAPVFKDQSFQEEREWRVVSLGSAFDVVKPLFREGRSTVIPYRKYAFPRSRPLPIEELIVGSTPHPDLARELRASCLPRVDWLRRR
jgi:hypothetical protein